MEGPGFSLFQGTESINLNTSAQRLEEEEALEDQKRRNEELQNQLQNAFDDLIDDDDDTVDNSSHIRSNVDGNNHNSYSENRIHRYPNGKHQHHNVLYNGGYGEGQADHLKNENEVAHLKNLLDSKTREFNHVNSLLIEERKAKESEINELTKRLSLTEAEKERAHMSRMQTHELLVESKAKISELDDTIQKHKNRIKTLEKGNNELVGELENCKTMLSDAQMKCHMIEKSAGFSADRHADALLKQVTERHNAQIEMMQQQIDNYRVKIDEKEMELKTLDTRYKELQRSREALLVDKSETINQLAKSLENSQRQCQQLITKPDMSHENVRLQRLVQALEKQTEDMQKTINNLTHRLESTSAELELMDSVLTDGNESMHQFASSRRFLPGSTPLQPEEKFSRLKNELYRCMNGQKAKREEIKKIEEQLHNKDDEIKKLRDDENKALIQMNQYKDDVTRLTYKNKILENELDKLRNKNCHDENNIDRDSNTEKSIKDESEQNIKKLEERIHELEMEQEELLTSNENLKRKNESLVNEIENLKTLSKSDSGISITQIDTLNLEIEKQKFLLKDAQNECERVKNLYIELSSSKDELNRELVELKASDVHKELYEQKERIVSLERALQLAEMKYSEKNKMLEKEKMEHDRIITELHDKYEKDKLEGLRDQKSSKNLSNNCSKCIDQLSEITKYEIQNIQLQNSCSNYMKEINELKNELKQSSVTINDLHARLGLKEEQDKVISALKEQAAKFNDYIRHQSSPSSTSLKNSSTSPQKIQSRDQSVSTSPELLTNDIQNRSGLREEYAKAFANQIKKLEEKHKQDLENSQSTIQSLNSEIDELKKLCHIKINEVDVLKVAILKERQNYESLFEAKKMEYEQVLMKLVTEVKKLTAKEQSLEKEMMEQLKQIEIERTSMQAVMSQWNQEKQLLLAQEENSKKKIEQINDKYESAKKTAKNYQKYAEDKEGHMKRELDRIKEGYQSSLLKLENRLAQFKENYDSISNEKISKIEAEYKKRLQDLSRNSKTSKTLT